MDWTRIKEDYVVHGLSLRSLVKKYGISYSTVQNRANRENWQLLRRGGEAVNPDFRENLDALCLRLLRLAEQAAEELSLNVTVTKTKTRTEDGECTTERRLLEPGGKVDCKDLKILTGALKDIRDLQMLRDPLDIREQEAKIRNLERQFAGLDSAVTVKLEGETEGFAQ